MKREFVAEDREEADGDAEGVHYYTAHYVVIDHGKGRTSDLAAFFDGEMAEQAVELLTAEKERYDPLIDLAERMVRALREDPQSPRATNENVYMLAGELERALKALETSGIAL